MKKIITSFLMFFVYSNVFFAQLKPVHYIDSNQILNGFSIQPKSKTQQKSGILILPAWMGIDKLSKDIAEKLSKLGYYAFVADIYGEGNYPKDYKEAGKIAGYYKTNFLEYQKRISLALNQLILSGANPENIVVIGYCFGGTGALEAARANLNVKGVVSFHGGLGRDVKRQIEPIKAKVLVCHGADDPYESKEEVTAFQQEMRDTKADWQMIYYANAVHSFTNPEAGNNNSKGAAYNEVAAKRSWEHLKLFLKEVLE
jgi:dienelactone hydrolase